MTQRSRSSSWLTLLLICAIVVLIYPAVHWLREILFPGNPSTLRGKAVYQIAAALALEWSTLAAMLFVLWIRGRTLSDLGWRKPSSIAGWLFAIGVAILYAGFLCVGLLRNSPILSDWSAFRILSALSLGITAGFCEEVIFRGFVMTEARDGGAPVIVQIVLSAVLFGLAHVAWGGFGGHGFDINAAIGAALSTGVLGALLASVYVVGRRSLMPVIASHALIDVIIEPWLILLALSGGFAHVGH